MLGVLPTAAGFWLRCFSYFDSQISTLDPTKPNLAPNLNETSLNHSMNTNANSPPIYKTTHQVVANDGASETPSNLWLPSTGACYSTLPRLSDNLSYSWTSLIIPIFFTYLCLPFVEAWNSKPSTKAVRQDCEAAIKPPELDHVRPETDEVKQHNINLGQQHEDDNEYIQRKRLAKRRESRESAIIEKLKKDIETKTRNECNVWRWLNEASEENKGLVEKNENLNQNNEMLRDSNNNLQGNKVDREEVIIAKDEQLGILQTRVARLEDECAGQRDNAKAINTHHASEIQNIQKKHDDQIELHKVEHQRKIHAAKRIQRDHVSKIIDNRMIEINKQLEYKTAQIDFLVSSKNEARTECSQLRGKLISAENKVRELKSDVNYAGLVHTEEKLEKEYRLKNAELIMAKTRWNSSANDRKKQVEWIETQTRFHESWKAVHARELCKEQEARAAVEVENQRLRLGLQEIPRVGSKKSVHFEDEINKPEEAVNLPATKDSSLTQEDVDKAVGNVRRDLGAEIASLKRNLAEFEEEKIHLEKELLQKKQDPPSSVREQKLESAVARYETLYADVCAERTKLSEQCHTLTSQRESLQNDVAKCRDKLQSYENDVHQYKADRQQNETNLKAQHERDIETLKHQFEQHVQGLSQQYAQDLHKQIFQKNQDIVTKADQITKHEATVADLTKDLRTSKLEAYNYKTQLDSSRNDNPSSLQQAATIATQKATITRLSKEKNTLLARAECSEDKYEDLQYDVAVLIEDKTKLQKEVGSLKQFYGKCQQDLKTLKDEQSQDAKKYEKAQENFEKAKFLVVEGGTKLHDAVEQWKECRRVKDETVQRHDLAIARINELEIEIQNLQREVEQREERKHKTPRGMY